MFVWKLATYRALGIKCLSGRVEWAEIQLR